MKKEIKKMGNYPNAGAGLKKMFIAEVGTIICAVLMIIPIVNILAAIGALVFLIISMVGLYGAGKDIAGCKTAFTITIISMVVSIVAAFFKTGFLNALFTIASAVLSLLVVYYVCTSVAEVMNQIGAADVAQKGLTVWKINLVCTIISVVATLIALIPLIGAVGTVINVVIAIVEVVAGILYMIFLNKSYQALGA